MCIKNAFLQSSGYLPTSSIRLNNPVSDLLIIAQLYFIISLDIRSGPELFPNFNFCIHILTSLILKCLSVILFSFYKFL